MTLSTIRMMMTAAALGVCAPMGGMVMAQTAAPQTAAQTTCPKGQTDDAGQAEAATQPDGGEDATAAENSGSTGWSGGTGGSQLGTNTQGAVDTSRTWHPPTARGLDLMGVAEVALDC